MRVPRSGQMKLAWEGDRLWEGLPDPIRRRCQELLTQLLAAVVASEVRERREEDEREDPADAS